MVRWHEDEAQLSKQRRASAVGVARGNGGRGVNRRSGRKPDQGNAGRGATGGGVEGNPTKGMGGNRRSTGETAVDEHREETADRVARHQSDYNSKRNMFMVLVPLTAAAGSNVVFLCFLFFLTLRFSVILLC